jgi:tetratricopeptide (TPR) repeat protein
MNPLYHRRNDLKRQGRVGEMVSVQLEILSQLQANGDVRDLANAWNYLSVLYQQLQRYDEAENAARSALSVYASMPNPRDETVACYEFVLAKILAAQLRFAEAVPLAE